jgi:hypothetical protein
MPVELPTITLYAEHLDFNPQTDFTHERRKTAVDIEIPIGEAKKLIKILQQRIDDEENRNSSFRVRFIGRIFV